MTYKKYLINKGYNEKKNKNMVSLRYNF
ncbi:MAG: hypothetical protein DRH34_06090 [Deltaproteobacteria bacterium]|nr:MAG: hypothetical protein DRH34_06090 [Deltaproteobacteria bacterium]RLC24523.1 MAG: hypothetical protein DRH93_04370 [Deltaproteobacteria bacterium]